MTHADCGGAEAFFHLSCKTVKLRRSIPPCKGCVCPPPTAGEQSGDRQRREKALPFLKEEKSEHERARTSMLAVQLYCARHCELPLSKMGNKGLFPVVAVPLAFFCTLFFRHRKKSVSAPWDGQSQSAPESARQTPPGAGDCACGRTGGFPLAPLHPLRIATRSNQAPHRAASPSPAPESARQAPPRGDFLRQSCRLPMQAGGLSARPLHPFGESACQWGRGMRLRAHWGLSSGQPIGAAPALPRAALSA